MQKLPLYPIIIPDALLVGGHGLAGDQVQAHGGGAAVVAQRVLHLDERVLHVQAGVLGQRLGHHQQRVRVRRHAQLRAPLHLGGRVGLQVGRRRHLEGARPGHHRAVLQAVLHGAQAVAERVLHLGDRVLVGALDQDGAALRVGHVLHEGVLLLAQRGLPHLARVAQHVLGHVLHAVDRVAPAGERQPLHVAPLGPPDGHDALLGEHVQRERVDALLVDHHEALPRLAHRALELDHGLHLVVGELALGLHHALALLGAAVEEAGLHLRLLVLEGHVHGQDAAVLQLGGHVRVPRPVVQHHAPHEARVGGVAVGHVQNLHHVQVQRLPRRAHAQAGVGHRLRDAVRQLGLEFGAEGGAGDVHQELAVRVRGCHLETVQKCQHSVSCQIETLSDDSGMKTL
mmetsp:Transcript_9834/g.15159  ORF Transcript_9834/g.15159 Transcript_9834/m.15159 type:complete len:399 (-) Transcript_9834:412-1608(-)